jgi:hypothetical protein
VDGETGVHFPEQAAVALDAAVDRLEHGKFDPGACRKRALLFDQRVFTSKLRAAADYLLGQR